MLLLIYSCWESNIFCFLITASCVFMLSCNDHFSVNKLHYPGDIAQSWCRMTSSMENFPCYWPFVRGIHWSPVNSPHKGQWRTALIISLICAWPNSWVNDHNAGDLRRHRAHHDVTVMEIQHTLFPCGLRCKTGWKRKQSRECCMTINWLHISVIWLRESKMHNHETDVDILIITLNAYDCHAFDWIFRNPFCFLLYFHTLK